MATCESELNFVFFLIFRRKSVIWAGSVGRRCGSPSSLVWLSWLQWKSSTWISPFSLPRVFYGKRYSYYYSWISNMFHSTLVHYCRTFLRKKVKRGFNSLYQIVISFLLAHSWHCKISLRTLHVQNLINLLFFILLELGACQLWGSEHWSWGYGCRKEEACSKLWQQQQ